MFWHTLALRLGMSVREAQEKIGEDEFNHWLAFNRIQPIGDDRMDVLFAMLSSLTANINRQKGQRSYNFNDFLPQWRPKRQSEEDLANLLSGLSFGSLRRT